ncbi:MAG: ArnT family glycosyltransferase [Candidatus Berkiella sp.]
MLALVLVAVRLWHVISFKEPLHVITSGFEEESLFALFKFVHDMPVYTDPHQIPFAASYFNWLYYGIYGTITACIMQLFHLGDIWIPTISRLITFSIATLGFIVTFVLFRRKQSSLAFCLSALLWYGPLVGYWAMTARPDVLGLFFDACALLFFLRYFPEHKIKAALVAAVFCYLSWSAKQINIVMPGTIGLFLLSHRQWRALFSFSGLLISLYALSCALMPENARKMLFFVNTAIPLSKTVFVENAFTLLKKTFPVLVITLAVIVEALRSKAFRHELFQSNTIQLSVCGLITWAVILLPASSKVGSAENYHFIALLFLLLFTASGLHLLNTRSRVINGGLILAGCLTIMSLGTVIAQNRTVHLTEQHQAMQALQKCIATLPAPIFVINHYGALPWMNPSSQSYVLAYNYWNDRKDGIPFEQNGIGGLIQQGYFNALVLPSPITDSFDGASLEDFSRQNSCPGYAVFTRKGTV